MSKQLNLTGGKLNVPMQLTTYEKGLFVFLITDKKRANEIEIKIYSA